MFPSYCSYLFSVWVINYSKIQPLEILTVNFIFFFCINTVEWEQQVLSRLKKHKYSTVTMQKCIYNSRQQLLIAPLIAASLDLHVKVQWVGTVFPQLEKLLCHCWYNRNSSIALSTLKDILYLKPPLWKLYCMLQSLSATKEEQAVDIRTPNPCSNFMAHLPIFHQKPSDNLLVALEDKSGARRNH